jgi:REP element-mobilizing transposase RayT
LPTDPHETEIMLQEEIPNILSKYFSSNIFWKDNYMLHIVMYLGVYVTYGQQLSHWFKHSRL